MTHQQLEQMFQQIEKEINVKYNDSQITFQEYIMAKTTIQVEKVKLIKRYNIPFFENIYAK